MTARLLIICGGSGVNLLGQRGTLGVQAELQIDWSREISPFVGRARDDYARYIELDRNIGTAGLLFREARNWFGRKPFQDLESSVYLHEGIHAEADAHYLRLLVDHLPASMSLDRSRALPAIGGLAICHPRNRVALEQSLERITAPLGLGPENPVEAWIVSSTVGSVGAGVHRFTGAFLADFIRRRYIETPVSLNFIQIGPLTYRSTNPRQTALNTFFGIAADAAFTLKLPQDFPGTAIHWFYIDFPDLGMGERGISLRAQMIAVAARAIMWEGLRETLQGLSDYNHGIPMAVARVGFWEGGLTEQRTYYEALRGLQERLQELIEPDYERKFLKESTRKPQLVADRLEEWLERVRGEEIVPQRLKFRYQVSRFQPDSLEEVRSLVEEWKGTAEDLVGRRWEDLQAEWAFEGASGREFLRVAEPGDASFGSEVWFRQMEEAQRAMAWARSLLGCDLRTGKPVERGKEGYLGELLTTVRRLSSPLDRLGLSLRREKSVREVGELLRKFVRTLVAVDALLRLEARARYFLDKELPPVLQVLEVVRAEFQKLWSQWAQPEYEQLITKEDVSFLPSPVFTTRLSRLQNAESLSNEIRRWRLPGYREFPSSLAEVRIRVTAWKEALNELFGEEWVSGGEFVVTSAVIRDGGRQEVIQPLKQWLDEEEDEQQLENAHFVRAWAWHLLGCDLRDGRPIQKPGTLLEQLHRQAQKLKWWVWLARIPMVWRIKKMSRWIGVILSEFFKMLVQVDHLLQAEELAANVLEQELRGEPLVTTLDVSDAIESLGRVTWLQALAEGIRRGDMEFFKSAVIRGSNGLEERGLRRILGLSRRTAVEDIHCELSSRIGRMKTDGKEVEAPWWAEESLQPSALSSYRLLPVLPSRLQERLRSAIREATSSFEYLFGFSELMPVAVEAASMAQEFGDLLTAPTVLLKPFVPLVKEVLSEWDYVSASNVPIRQLEIVSAGVWGEPLYELALKAAGLDEEELRKIGQYYTFHRR